MEEDEENQRETSILGPSGVSRRAHEHDDLVPRVTPLLSNNDRGVRKREQTRSKLLDDFGFQSSFVSFYFS